MNNALKWGGIMGVALVILNLALYMAGMINEETGSSGVLGAVLSYVFSIVPIVLGIKAYKDAQDGYLTVGDGVKQGMLIGIIGGLIMAVYSIVFFTMIAPEILEVMKDSTLSQQSGIDDDQADIMGSMMGFVFNPAFMAAMTVMMKFFLGLIVGLITGAVIQNVRPFDSDTL